MRHRQPNAIVAELIPAVRRRVGAAPPARAAAAPLVVVLLDDGMAGRQFQMLPESTISC